MDTKQAELMALELMTTHGLRNWNKPETVWAFRLDRSVSRFGCCSYKRKTISLSRAIVELNPVEAVRDTILHEIAHVLAGSAAGHGPIWKVFAIGVGAKPETCAPVDTVTPTAPWEAVCQYCKRTLKRHRLTKRIKEGSYCACPVSRAQGTKRVCLEWRQNGQNS